MNNMTAKVSCFARAYHYKNNKNWIFKDEIAGQLLGDKEYETIAEYMTNGIQFFVPEFEGSKEDALKVIVDNQLSPTVLGRSAFAERHLLNEVKLGCTQYVLFAAGYDTFAFRKAVSDLKVFELDLPEMISDKKQRMEQYGLSCKTDDYFIPCNLANKAWQNLLHTHGFENDKKSFGSLLGLSYYLDKKDFASLISGIADIWKDSLIKITNSPLNEMSSDLQSQVADTLNEAFKKGGYEASNALTKILEDAAEISPDALANVLELINTFDLENGDYEEFIFLLREIMGSGYDASGAVEIFGQKMEEAGNRIPID